MTSDDTKVDTSLTQEMIDAWTAYQPSTGTDFSNVPWAVIQEIRRAFHSGYRVAIQSLPKVTAERDELRASKDEAYKERTYVVSMLARLFPSGIKRTDIPGWEPEWHGCVYIDMPAGQVSWHYHESLAFLFASLPPYAGEWDGHDTSEKYQRLFKSVDPAVAERDALSARVKELEAAQPYFLTERINLQGVGALVIERDALKHALANMLEDGDKTDREAAMKLLGWDKAAPELQARALIGKEPS